MINRFLSLASLLAIGAVFASNAYATLIDVEGSYELDAALVNVPTSTNGYLLLRSCSQCAVKSLQVSEQTQYFLGRDRVTLQEFQENSVMQGLIYVFYDKETQRVTRVRLRAGSLGNNDE